MKLTEVFLAELDREAPLTRKMLSNVPDHKTDWKPHPRSMPMGYLTVLCATIFGWIDMIVNRDELDLNPKDGSGEKPADLPTSAELVAALDANVARARAALQNTTDEHLLTGWRLLSGGHVAQEDLRHIFIRDAVFQHLAHHRGQLTVYLRLNEAKVPGTYGPSADEPGF